MTVGSGSPTISIANEDPTNNPLTMVMAASARDPIKLSHYAALLALPSASQSLSWSSDMCSTFPTRAAPVPSLKERA